MGLRPHYLMDLIAGAVSVVTLAVYWFAARSLEPRLARNGLRFTAFAAATAIALGVMLAPVRIGSHFPNDFVQWARCLAIFVAAWVLYSIPIATVLGLT